MHFILFNDFFDIFFILQNVRQKHFFYFDPAPPHTPLATPTFQKQLSQFINLKKEEEKNNRATALATPTLKKIVTNYFFGVMLLVFFMPPPSHTYF